MKYGVNMKTVKGEFAAEALIDEGLLEAKDVVYKTLKKYKFSNVIKNEKFFEFYDDEDEEGNAIVNSVHFRIEPWDLPGIIAEMLSQRLNKIGCCVEYRDEGDYIDFDIVTKANKTEW